MGRPEYMYHFLAGVKVISQFLGIIWYSEPYRKGQYSECVCEVINKHSWKRCLTGEFGAEEEKRERTTNLKCWEVDKRIKWKKK